MSKKMVVAFVGHGKTTWQNAEDLLQDFWPPDVNDLEVLVPSNYTAGEYPGLNTVVGWMDAVEQPYIVVPLTNIILSLNHATAEEKYLIALGPEGITDILNAAWQSRIPVLDLCEGLDEITPVSALRKVTEIPLEASEKAPKPRTARTQPRTRVSQAKAVESVTEPQAEKHDEDSIKYYKSKRGKFRKAGRSKIKPGETEVWLTPLEVMDLAN